MYKLTFFFLELCQKFSPNFMYSWVILNYGPTKLNPSDLTTFNTDPNTFFLINMLPKLL